MVLIETVVLEMDNLVSSMSDFYFITPFHDVPTQEQADFMSFKIDVLESTQASAGQLRWSIRRPLSEEFPVQGTQPLGYFESNSLAFCCDFRVLDDFSQGSTASG